MNKHFTALKQIEMSFVPLVINQWHKRYRDGAGNTVEENSSIFSLIRMR